MKYTPEQKLKAKLRNKESLIFQAFRHSEVEKNFPIKVEVKNEFYVIESKL